MMQVWRALNEPFPDESHPKKLFIAAFSVSLFVVAFLYFFQPFNINQYQGSKILLCFGFGSCHFCCCHRF